MSLRRAPIRLLVLALLALYRADSLRDLSGAIALLQEAARAQPRDPVYPLNLAQAFLFLPDYDQAAAALSASLSVLDYAAVAVFGLAVAPAQAAPLAARRVSVTRRPVITGVNPPAIARGASGITLTLTGRAVDISAFLNTANRVQFNGMASATPYRLMLTAQSMNGSGVQSATTAEAALSVVQLGSPTAAASSTLSAAREPAVTDPMNGLSPYLRCE